MKLFELKLLNFLRDNFPHWSAEKRDYQFCSSAPVVGLDPALRLEFRRPDQAASFLRVARQVSWLNAWPHYKIVRHGLNWVQAKSFKVVYVSRRKDG